MTAVKIIVGILIISSIIGGTTLAFLIGHNKETLPPTVTKEQRDQAASEFIAVCRKQAGQPYFEVNTGTPNFSVGCILPRAGEI